MSMTRGMAAQERVKVGAIPEQTTTKRTNVLIAGDINPAALRPGSDLTGGNTQERADVLLNETEPYA